MTNAFMKPNVPTGVRARRQFISPRGWGLTILLALLFAEGVARHFISGPIEIVRPSADAKLLYELRPGHYLSDGYLTRTEVVEYTVDERGCRLVEGAPSPTGEAILFLGSSIVFGIGVDSRSALPEAARDEIRRQSANVDFVPLNCSVPGYNLLQTLHHAESAIDIFGVKSLAIVIGPTHGSIAYDWTRMAPSSGLMRWLTAHVRLIRLGYLVYMARQANDFQLPPVPTEELGAALDHFASFTAAKGVRVVMFPIGAFKHPEFSIVSELNKRGMQTVPIEAPPNEPRYMVSDGDHWSSEGVRFMVRQALPGLWWLLQESPTSSQ